MPQPDAADTLARLLADRLGGRWRVRALGASGFASTWRAESPCDGALFAKTLPAQAAGRLEAEADGLAALATSGTVRVPAPVGCWRDGPDAVLAIEWLELAGPADGRRLGRAIGALHASPPPGDGRFGWRRDNFLGSTPQPNRWSDTGGTAGWIAFVAERRLLPLRDALIAAGAPAALARAVDGVVAALPRFFDDGHVPRPSLIHGDLWSGNHAALGDGTPVVYDPAVSVSDAEAELAMMELFGSIPPGFWPAYREVAGLAAGYPRRRPLYQLHHLLNHALLFGGGYVRQSQALAERLAAG